jgi:hypothetical protein
MHEGKGMARGLEEVFSLFLSSTESDHSAEAISRSAPSPTSAPLLVPIFCCVSPSPAVESFFTCNLSVEIAKNDRTVTIIDFGFERSIVRSIIGYPNPTPGAFHPENTVYQDPDSRAEASPSELIADPPKIQPKDKIIDLREFRREIGIDISNVSDEELLDLLD